LTLKILHITLFLMFSQVIKQSIGQSFHPPIQNYSPKHYGNKNTPENWCIIQDSKGLIYSAVGNAVIQYDGYSWRTIPVKKGRYTVSLDIDSDDIIYVGAQEDFGALLPNKSGDLKFNSFVPLIPLSDNFIYNYLEDNSSRKFCLFPE